MERAAPVYGEWFCSLWKIYQSHIEALLFRKQKTSEHSRGQILSAFSHDVWKRFAFDFGHPLLEAEPIESFEWKPDWNI
jgi:hypothetical protein